MNVKNGLDVLAVIETTRTILVADSVGIIFGKDNAENDLIESIGSINVYLACARTAVADVFAAARDAAAILQSKHGDMEQETFRRLYDALERAGAL